MMDVATDSTIMPPAKRRRVTVTASRMGIDRAEKALVRLGVASKSSFAKTRLMGKSTVDKFFNQQPIQLDSFQRICEELGEDWKRIAELEPVVEQWGLEESGKVAESIVVEVTADQPMSMKLMAARQITVADRESGKVHCEIVLEGDIASIDAQVQKTLETILRNLSGPTITITDIQAGSIRIRIQGSSKDAARLIDRFTSGKFTEINEFPVEHVEILSQDFLEEAEESSVDNKWDLVREITLHPGSRRQLSGVDLSDVDLSRADLSGADLSGADLSGADLSRADLSRADLSRADLSGADLSGADLSRADLSRADLSGADLSGADLGSGYARAHAYTRAHARASTLALARALARTLAFARALALVVALTLASTSAFVLAIALALALTLAPALAPALARALLTPALAHALDRALTPALDRALDRARARARAPRPRPCPRPR
jgi:hypothetical protein